MTGGGYPGRAWILHFATTSSPGFNPNRTTVQQTAVVLFPEIKPLNVKTTTY
jgi:hypothetical protein